MRRLFQDFAPMTKDTPLKPSSRKGYDAKFDIIECTWNNYGATLKYFLPQYLNHLWYEKIILRDNNNPAMIFHYAFCPLKNHVPNLHFEGKTNMAAVVNKAYWLDNNTQP